MSQIFKPFDSNGLLFPRGSADVGSSEIKSQLSLLQASPGDQALAAQTIRVQSAICYSTVQYSTVWGVTYTF